MMNLPYFTEDYIKNNPGLSEKDRQQWLALLESNLYIGSNDPVTRQNAKDYSATLDEFGIQNYAERSTPLESISYY
jgi:hypothetical protein